MIDKIIAANNSVYSPWFVDVADNIDNPTARVG